MRFIISLSISLLGVCYYGCQSGHQADQPPRRIEVLFLGHDSEHHNSAQLMPMLASALSKEGINLTYTDQIADLNPEKLEPYDALMLYANYDEINPSQEKALLNFVKEGKGFIPVHCASFCFQNSPEYIDLVGGQFQQHDTGTFVASIVQKNHPAMEGVTEFSTWDETYVHQKQSDDRTILMERVAEDHREPWTWTKTYGDGRVFYTAYGHDERTWSQPGFHRLMQQGILWAVGEPVKSLWQAYQKDMPSLTYKEMPGIPNYEKRNPPPQFQEPLSPEESKKLIQVPVGFTLELFASEPDIINPVAMEWDERGRLWVIETVDYPNTVRNQDGVGDDRIKICEDTDGDGKADKFTVFAEQLNIPTSLVFARGGVIISQAPHLLFLKDTDGDDKADLRQELISGWGTFDTHAGPSNLQYGIDNWIWGTVGYSGFKGTISGKYYEFSQGLYRFTPDASRFEYITPTSNNTWGLGFTESFDVFGSTANNTHSVYMGIPNRYYEGVEGLSAQGSKKIDGHYAMHPITEKVRQVDVFGGFTAASGHNFYTARSYPATYWKRMALVCEPTGHLLHMAMIEKQGAGFIEKDGWNLLASTDEWVAPVEAKVGPDGAVWVLDWYNFIVQHNPTPTPERGGYEAKTGEGNAYVNPLRDKSHGRVWRIVYKDAPPYQPVTLSREHPEQWVDVLKNDNLFWRTTAQRLLVERGGIEVLPALYKLINRKTTGEHADNPAAIHALWTLHGLGVLDDSNEEAYKVAISALHHPAPGVRKAAVQVLPRTPWANRAILQSQVLHDADPHTRLAAILAVADMEPSEALGQRLYRMSMEDSVRQDAWLSQAVYVAAAKHASGFSKAFLAAHPNYEAEQDRQEEKEIQKEVGFDDTNWQSMNLPGSWEQKGLDIDGVVWFRKTIDLPPDFARQKGTIQLGPIDDSDETWINGIKVGGLQDKYAENRKYPVAAGILKPGKNVVAVKVEDYRNAGGFGGQPDQMFIQTGKLKKPLAGAWKYEVAEIFSSESAPPIPEQVSIAELFMDNYRDSPKPDAPLAAEATGEAAPTVIHIETVKNAMKYDVQEIVVAAGKAVEIVFANPDFMQHNLLIIAPGSIQTVGAAADQLATDPDGAEKNYVPDIPEVLYYTKLLNPDETVKLTFTAPNEPGEYPYLCTFPGHWRIMQGVMKVVSDPQTI